MEDQDNANNYDYDCGRCGNGLGWEELKDAGWICHYCGWDSVRITPKEVINEHPTVTNTR